MCVCVCVCVLSLAMELMIQQEVLDWSLYRTTSVATCTVALCFGLHTSVCSSPGKKNVRNFSPKSIRLIYNLLSFKALLVCNQLAELHTT